MKTQNVKPLHHNNAHRYGYDFQTLAESHNALNDFLISNSEQTLSLDYSHPDAVFALNAALLQHYYQIRHWSLPNHSLCPAVPGRVDYIHHMADIVGKTQSLRMLDIGTGASGIYPILAQRAYRWQCVGSDISQSSLDNVLRIMEHNPDLKASIEVRLQADPHAIFEGIIKNDEYFALSVCNPPFHSSQQAANKANQQKNRQLYGNNQALNFGGQANELWCNGGEKLFIKKMIKQSEVFAQQVGWFSSLVSKTDTLKPSIKLINKLGAKQVESRQMQHGNKICHLLAWRF